MEDGLTFVKVVTFANFGIFVSKPRWQASTEFKVAFANL